MKRFLHHSFACGLLLIGGLSLLFGQPQTITILHTNDMHASFLPHEAFWVGRTPKPLVGGLNELSYEIDSIRHVKTSTLLIDAGDVIRRRRRRSVVCHDAHDRL
jgi:2',3'-cyclic-nucleotide 2'-phosphodiesterase (5'-nucleotidase family)